MRSMLRALAVAVTQTPPQPTSPPPGRHAGPEPEPLTRPAAEARAGGTAWIRFRFRDTASWPTFSPPNRRAAWPRRRRCAGAEGLRPSDGRGAGPRGRASGSPAPVDPTPNLELAGLRPCRAGRRGIDQVQIHAVV